MEAEGLKCFRTLASLFLGHGNLPTWQAEQNARISNMPVIRVNIVPKFNNQILSFYENLP